MRRGYPIYTLTETKTDPKNPMVWKRDFLSTKGIVAVHVVFLESKQFSQEQLFWKGNGETLRADLLK